MYKTYIGYTLITALMLILALDRVLHIFDYVFAAAIVLGILAIIAMVCYVIYVQCRNRFGQVLRVPARVVRKRGKDWSIPLPIDSSPIGMLGSDPDKAWDARSKLARLRPSKDLEITGGTDLYMTFFFNAHEEEFIVPENVYISFDEGAEGLLVYQGEAFRDFIPFQPDCTDAP